MKQVASRKLPVTRTRARPVIFLIGPTGAGKTEVSILLSERINAEVICCDSMQIYKGMDIITAKPTSEQIRTVRHHLFSIKNPNEEFNVAEYRQKALRILGQIQKKGKIAIFVGGTGLYMQVLLDGLFLSLPKDIQQRQALRQQADIYGNDYLYSQLKQVDVAAASEIHPNDVRRIIRALEVFKLTGRPISEWKKASVHITTKTAINKTHSAGIYGKYPLKIFCLYYQKRESLYKNINSRVEEMLEEGAIDEVKSLLKTDLSLTAQQALGIKEIKNFLDGNYNLQGLKELLKRNTRRYAKRQMTWFRRDNRVKWIPIDNYKNPSEVVEKIRQLIQHYR